MLTVDEALARILAEARPLAPRSWPLEAALGCLLAEDAVADRDSPPYAKSMVDGYAVCAADLAAGRVEWEVVEEVLAGRVPSVPLAPGLATRIMTGAPVPPGSDAVVMVEHSEVVGGTPERPIVRLRIEGLRAGQNVMPQGQSLHAGAIVARRGTRLRGVEIGALAEIGCARPLVVPRPQVAILSTGDELVAADEQPGPGQIRNSNGPMLAALARQAGAIPLDGPIVRDTTAALATAIRRGLEADVLILSGGVSAGVADLVPAELAAAGVRPVFHKIHLRPGKPLWFGVAERTDPSQPPRLVFGLPGNPVSSLVCFELFVRPALRGLAGLAPRGLRPDTGTLTARYRHKGDRPTFFPAVARRISSTGVADEGSFRMETGNSAPTAARYEIELLPWHGSADLATVTQANSLACFPAGSREYARGESLEFRWLPSGDVDPLG